MVIFVKIKIKEVHYFVAFLNYLNYSMHFTFATRINNESPKV